MIFNRNTFLQKEYFLVLLPLFFIFHGFTENYPLVPVKDSLLLFAFYLLIIGALGAFFYWIYRSFQKAAFFTFLLLGFHFFFGSAHDASKDIFGNLFFTRYTFIILTSIAGFVWLFFLVKRRKHFSRLFFFVNTVLLLLILLDGVFLSGKIIATPAPSLPAGLSVCDTCPKKDIYLIIADEYAGNHELRHYFGYDNSSFENELTRRGFCMINNSKSNYNFTPFSVASMLNMAFLPIKDPAHTTGDVPMVMRLIEENLFTRYLHHTGYKVINNSVFNIPREPAKTQTSFLPAKTVYITAQTFLSRLKRDIAFNLVTRFRLEGMIKAETYANDKNNQFLYEETKKATAENGSPKFCYTHLMLPHWPYYYNAKGQPYDFHQLSESQSKPRYLAYLQYANKKYIELVDFILKNNRNPPIILLISDHGYRIKDPALNRQFTFSNFVSVFLPDKNYAGFYDGLSNVNLLRLLVNKEFRQNMPLLKDSSSLLND